MNFWKLHDIALLKIWEKAVHLTDEFEKTNNMNDINYNLKLDRFLKKKLGKEVNFLSKASVLYSLKSFNLS